MFRSFAVFAVPRRLACSLRSRHALGGLAALVLLPACANMPGSQALQESLEADPALQTTEPAPSPTPDPTASPTSNPTASPTPSPTPNPTASPTPDAPNDTLELPSDFPDTLPQYPDAQLLDVTAGDDADPQRVTWTSRDGLATVRDFYKRELDRQNWSIVQRVWASDESSFTVNRDGIQAKVALTAPADASSTEIAIDYAIAAANALDLNDATAVRSDPASPDASRSTKFSDLDAVTEPLRDYVTDVAALGILSAKDGDRFAPSETAARRVYVRWLFDAHNRIYADRPSEQIRPVSADSATAIAFQDVPKSDPDFAIVQGLAEAGILPSPLNGNDTTTQFRPDEPLTRETLVGWKVPLDRRRSLPTATIDALQNTWGFQDTERIDPLALRALLVDFQNGDLSVVRRTFGYTALFQPKKAVTRAEAAASLWYFGFQGDGRSAKTALESAGRDAN